MNKRTVSLLIVVLMILSAIPVALPGTLVSAEDNQQIEVTHKITKLPVTTNEPIKIDPKEKIEPTLLKILENPKRLENNKLLVYIFTDGSKPKTPLKIIGERRIKDITVYLAELPLTDKAELKLLKTAYDPNVLEISRANPNDPLSIFNEPDVTVTNEEAKEQINDLRLKAIEKRILYGSIESSQKTLAGYKIVTPLELIKGKMGKIDTTQFRGMTHYKQIPSNKFKENPSTPTDYFAVYHHGSLNTWLDLGVTGAGINVAVVDSGVDFGNPDLQDAYAVELNPESPYYGWPIAFDGNSMMAYLLYNLTFPSYAYSWYSNTSLVVANYTILNLPMVIGYKGNFTTVFSAMSLANILDEAERAMFINQTLSWMNVTGPILVVDDDGGENNGGFNFDVDPYYLEALDLIGVNYTLIRVPAGEDGPNATVLSNYSAIIWFTGEEWENTLTDNDLRALYNYLNKGGKFFLISQDYLYDKSDGSILSNWSIIYEQQNVTAPETDNETVHYFNLTTNVSVLRVRTISEYSDLDIDLKLYYYNETAGEWEYLGGSYGFTANEEVIVENPLIGQYMAVVYSYDNPDYPNATYTIIADTANVLAYFTSDYLHVGDSIEDVPVPTLGEDSNGNKYHIGSINKGAVKVESSLFGPLVVPSFTDMYADYLIPDNESEVILMTYAAYPVTGGNLLLGVKLPMNDNLEVPTKSGVVHLGLHPDLQLAVINTHPLFLLFGFIFPPWVLVTDPIEAGRYDTVYVDLTSELFGLADFNEDTGHTKDNPVIQFDVFDMNGNMGSDGYADLSGGMIYYIANGTLPIPYSDVVYTSWDLGAYGIDFKIPKNGEMVAFMIGTPFTGGGDHGTLCAAAVAARGRTFLGLTFGNAPGAKIIAEGSLYMPLSSWIDFMYFAVQGYDGVPYTGDEALVVSNSYGNSYTINKGYDWEDRFLYYLTHYYAPFTTFLFAAGNGGPGYGTVTSNGASPAVITVGAAVEFGYRNLFGYDGGPMGFEYANYGDVVDFSNRGPNALGQVDPDVLAVGAYALGSEPVNMFVNGFWASDLWAGTSLATPMAAGITALVYQAYYQTHGTLPTMEEVKEILMSTAKNVNHDVFSQGAGFLNAYDAVQAAMNLDGIVVSPSSWQAGRTEYPAFANVLYPGDSVSKVFEIENKNMSTEKNVTISAEVFEKIGEVQFNVSSDQIGELIRIDQYIPKDTDLLKVTMYIPFDEFDTNGDYQWDTYLYFELFGWTDVNGNGTLEFWYETNRLQLAFKPGTTASTTLGDPWSKFVDGLFLRVRSGGIHNVIKLEFYKRVPWNWIKLNETSLTIPAGEAKTFKATLEVPEDTPYGVYEGAIYVAHDGKETTIPISVVVASPTPEFQFGGDSSASGLYDNSNVYGYFDWLWRYEAGDWRLFYFNVSNSYRVDETYIVADISWDGKMPTDIDLHLLGPSSDFWSSVLPQIYGPYALKEIAASKDTYMGSGIFMFQTSSGTNREIIAGKAQNGLHALWLHNVLFNSTRNYVTFSGRIGLLNIHPSEISDFITSENGSFSVLISRTFDFGNIRANAALANPIMYENVIAPDTDYSHYYSVIVNNSVRLDVILTSIWDDLAGLDLDLYVYYNASGELIQVGSSLTSTSDERVTIDFPEPGQYIIEVYGWNNPAPGEATYDLVIYNFETKNIKVSEISKAGQEEYLINVEYHDIPVSNETIGRELKGILFIGSDLAPTLVGLPLTFTIGNVSTRADIALVGFTVPEDSYVGENLTINSIFVNKGPTNASDVRVLLLRDNVQIDSVTIGTMEPNEAYEVNFTIPADELGMHEYKVIVASSNDYNMDNNYNVAYVNVVPKPENITEDVLFMKSVGGYAEITSTEVTNRKINLVIDGDHGALVTLLVKLPKALHYYNVHVTDADLISKELITTPSSHILKLTIQLHSPAEVEVDYMTTGEALQEINFVWYMLYQRYRLKFDELYNKSIELGIDNETIQEALHYKELAEENYKESWKFGNPLQGYIRSLPYMRRAYLNMKKAVEILSKAIEEAESS